MTYYISFSGGAGSAVTALVAYEQGLDFELLFADTRIEDQDLYRFNEDVAKAVGKQIIVLRDGRTPWDVYIDRKFIGNTRVAHCSTELKTKPVKRWLVENASEEDPLVLGMDWSEQDRIDRAKKLWDPRPVVSLLNEYRITRPMFPKLFEKYGIRTPRLYDQGFLHNNCGGFCCKAGQGQFELLLKTNPERYKWHEQEMDRAMAQIGKTAKPFLRVTIDGELKYLTLKEYRERVEAGDIQQPLFSNHGCGCFTDG